jgi:hypothetical protein
VRYDMVVDGETISLAEPGTPPKLIISYIADGNDAETRKLHRADF